MSIATSIRPAAKVQPTSARSNARLEVLETKVRAGFKAFREAGNALREIRDRDLFRVRYPTFEEYCLKQWGMSRFNAYKIMKASEIASQVSGAARVEPESPAQMGPLGRLPVADRPLAWKEAVNKSRGNPTRRIVEAVVGRRLGKPEMEQVQGRTLTLSQDPAYAARQIAKLFDADQLKVLVRRLKKMTGE